jgi:NCS1 family nucleobase:cation symporter-1
VVIIPLLPGLAHAVTPDNIYINIGLEHLYSINYLYGFSLFSVTFYFALNYFWPHRRTLIPVVVLGVFAAHLTGVDLYIETTIMEGKMVGNLEKVD